MKFIVVVFLCLGTIWASPKDVNPRIIGGELAEPGQFPFLAAIRYVTEAEGEKVCGGIILNNQWILTAAHCLVGALGFTVHLGTTSLQSEGSKVFNVTASSYIAHESYSSTLIENDIGLLKVSPIEFTDDIKPIESLPSARTPEDIPTIAVGWGRTTDGDDTFSDDLYHVPLTTLRNENCALFFGTFIKNTMLCAIGNTNEGTCLGDSGGPLIQVTESGVSVPVGIASFNSGLGCETTEPSGFTRIYEYTDWIANVTASSGSKLILFVPVIIVAYIVSIL